MKHELDPETGCWVWKGWRNRDGYGAFHHGKRTVFAHRYYYAQAMGPIPYGLTIDHLCHNRACVNPAHMEVVTRRENSRRGYRTKLTPEKVRLIRIELRAGQRAADVGPRFGVSRTTVNRIRQGMRGEEVTGSWSDVT